MNSFYNSDKAKEMLSFKMPRFEELPGIELYLDQLLSIINLTLEPIFEHKNEAVLTSPMVSNYVKQKIVAPPVKKRYTKEHVVYFIVITIFKQILSISEVGELIKVQMDCYGTGESYNYFCDELERVIGYIFGGKEIPLETGSDEDDERKILRVLVISVVNKIYIEKYLEYKKM